MAERGFGFQLIVRADQTMEMIYQKFFPAEMDFSVTSMGPFTVTRTGDPAADSQIEFLSQDPLFELRLQRLAEATALFSGHLDAAWEGTMIDGDTDLCVF